MSVRPPAEKLPLAVRKEVRDEWEAKKPDLEKKLSDLLGTPWTVDVSPNALWPYAESSYAKDYLGSCIVSYIEGAIARLERFLSTYSDLGKNELNSTCSKHSITIAFDEKKKFSYCGVDFKDGQLRILFAENDLGTNATYALDTIDAALNEASTSEAGSESMSFLARGSIQDNWNPKIEDLKAKIKDQLKFDMALNPNFEESYKKLKANEKKASLRDDWDQYFGSTIYDYFEAFLTVLENNKFSEDDLLREGVEEGVEKKEVNFRVVDKLQKGSYNETVLEDGSLFLQTTPESWTYNARDIATRLIDLF